MSGIFDLVVIGGGPAGTSAAITAARLGLSVALLEAGKFPRHKVCGEFISGEALWLLDQLLGSTPIFEKAPRISFARMFLDGRVLGLPLDPAAASLSRYEMDLALWNATRNAGVALFDNSRVRSISRTSNSFLVAVNPEEFQARAVIQASGRWSNLTPHRPPTSHNWIGLKQHFREESAEESCDLYFFDGGYCGVQPLGDGIINAAAMVRANVAKSLGSVFSLNRELAARATHWRSASEPVSTAPLVFTPSRTSAEGVLLCGDAAAFLDPFAGDGISMALHSGRLATLSLAAYLRGECSLQSAIESYDRYHRELIQPALKNAAWLRRLVNTPRPFRMAAIFALRLPGVRQTVVRRTRVRTGYARDCLRARVGGL